MNNIYRKKIVGTAVIGIFLLSLTLAGASFAYGKNGNNKAHKFSGEVVSISEEELVLDTDEQDDTSFELTDKTTFTRGLDWDDINVGDSVRIISKYVDESYVAKVVQKDNGAGYGRKW